MKKFCLKFTPIIILALFIVVMLSGNYLKKPITTDDDVIGLIRVVMDNVNKEEWSLASENANKLNYAWNKVEKRIQFSSERDEMNELSASIARLKGAIMAKDRSISLVELNLAYEHWEGLAK
ncbi:DUF4363 family protein [Clostridium rectalis]|uniref:DUF4363 family protein n=1 Tax=Clostridium rectalis TaxID=2040295 RepID=UPI001FAA4678|nr:DUF4363 family protein [Clostridium rectalis]